MGWFKKAGIDKDGDLPQLVLLVLVLLYLQLQKNNLSTVVNSLRQLLCMANISLLLPMAKSEALDHQTVNGTT
jgi:hypothetical protein